MNTKLTLTLDKSVIIRAKSYAEKHGVSLSAIVENYLKAVTERETNSSEIELSPIVKSLRGAFKIPVELDYKEEIKNMREERYQKYLNSND